MEYTYPTFFYDFECEASKCSDTCCKGWGIAIDPISLKKYKRYPGFFGNRLKNSIDWKTGYFEQYNGRCAFLNEENLCDIYTEAGKEMLCKTCTRYPRHYEEYENLREISLSLSCPAAAKLILGSDQKITFLNDCRETPEEEYEQFDFFLFTKLCEIRDYFYEVVQNRKLPVKERMALILAISHDLQKRIEREQLYAIDDLLKRYRTPAFLTAARKKFRAYQDQPALHRVQRRQMLHTLYRLEALRPEWHHSLKRLEGRLYQELKQEEYQKACQEFNEFYQEKTYEYEQLLMYFLFNHVCTAVYDKDLYSKIKLTVVHTLLIQELDIAIWVEKDKTFTFDDQIKIVHRYAREIEHSDPNLDTIDHMMAEDELFTLEKLLTAIF